MNNFNKKIIYCTNIGMKLIKFENISKKNKNNFKQINPKKRYHRLLMN